MLHKGLCLLAGAALLGLSGCGGSGTTLVSGGGGSTQATCPLATLPPISPKVGLQQVFTGLSFNFPVGLMQAPGDNSRWYVLERAGVVRVFANNPNVSAAGTFIDISSRVDQSGEGGLLGMAFHPAFAQNGQVFLSYTRPGAPLISYVSRFTSRDHGATLDGTSEQPIITLDQPFDNHNGGNIAFGPDGYLYIGFGDGGGAGDPMGNGQNTNNLFATILRVDVDRGTPYAIPPTNPFVAGGGRPEIYAYGLRNPWRFNFDAQTQALWAGDVGQDHWEEVDCIQNGGNYGWSVREGAHCFRGSICNSAGMIDPVVEYDHSQGNCAIVGGYVYRGTAIPALRGAYVYGDLCSGRIWALYYTALGVPNTQVLVDSGIGITSFGQGNDGELYVMGQAGKIYRLVRQ